jgi:hypothetical protein
MERQKEAHDACRNKSEWMMTQFSAMLEKHRRMEKTMKQNEAMFLKKAAEIAHWKRKIKTTKGNGREATTVLDKKKRFGAPFPRTEGDNGKIKRRRSEKTGKGERTGFAVSTIDLGAIVSQLN